MAELAQEDWQQRAIAAEQRADEAWTQYHKLAAEVESYKTDSVRLHYLENSISWRITAPLRVFKWLFALLKANLPKLRALRAEQP